MKSVAVIWSRFGPYHLARLRGAAAAFARDGTAVHGIEVAESDPDYAWEPAASPGGFGRHVACPGGDYGRLGARRIGRAVRALLERLSPGAVAINGWSVAESRAALAWCRERGRAAVLMSESKADDHPRRAWREAVKARRVRRFDAALVGGRMQRDYAVALGVPPGRVFEGYDAVDHAYFAGGSDAARAEAAAGRERLGLPARYVYANTRFLPRKNLDGLLRAYARYRAASGSPWGLVVTGDGAERARLLALAAALGLGGVRWPGFVQYAELPFYYGLASAFVHPARSEPWGLVVNEAAAAALPLLVSRAVGARYELVEDGVNGLLFDPADPAALAAALGRVAAAGEGERAAMGRRAREVAAAWGPERFGEGLRAACRAAREGAAP